LPASLRALHTRNTIELSHKRWHADTDALILQLERHGIAPRASPASGASGPVAQARPTEPSPRTQHGLLRPIAQFLPDLFALVRHPRRFLRQRARGRGTELALAFVFFALAVSCAVAIIVTGYDPMQSAFGLGLAVWVAGLMATLALSLPLWIGWRLVGATRHYGKLLVLLLYQSGVLHIVWAFVLVIVLFGFELSSRHLVSDVIAEFMRPGHGIEQGFGRMLERIGPAADTPAVRIAVVAAGLVALAGCAWLVASWGAYRDALGFGRLRSLAALILAGLVVWAGATVIGLVS
jgi:hypothetical protein